MFVNILEIMVKYLCLLITYTLPTRRLGSSRFEKRLLGGEPPWPEMTDIINILIRCEFAYHVEFGFICDY